MRIKLFFLSLIFLSAFTYFSYTVAKEKWQKIDFDTTVKLQDHIPRRFDEYFSYLSLVGSAEVTVGFCLIMSSLSLIGSLTRLRLNVVPFLGWLMIIPASMGEIFGKLVLFHPAPPVFLHRTLLATGLPSFYVHTDFSYPSGHMARTVFIATIFLSIALFQSKDLAQKIVSAMLIISLVFLMGLTRIYLGEHWLSDVIGGSMLGAGIGFLASVLILKPRLD